ncbi:hypothetical protein AV521_02690 [Streptomyces sp. IMTB 2501]|uniref:hypothetical protein n=1 Tax=Streptomyces sp. IMTB 2501 TaxID=1776340 RepID=UPI00096C7407|nr:hypothetical protein [Streptomyces sp. IMTB 2501]OLZ74558.1 hypothetical protein AV521_02690 [Streptomyces sp. IMTB 2501]
MVHVSVRQLHKTSGQRYYATWGEPVPQTYTTGPICVFSVRTLEAMKNLGVRVTHEDCKSAVGLVAKPAAAVHSLFSSTPPRRYGAPPRESSPSQLPRPASCVDVVTLLSALDGGGLR